MLTQFTGYAVDCTVEGEFDLTADRLRDQLNDLEQVVLLHATLTRLVDGSQLCVPRLVLERDELCAVEASPAARGLEGRRLHTVRHRRRVRMGPYSVLGHLHERPGVQPLGSMRLVRPFVAFTDARIAFQRGGSMEVRDIETLLVNGRQIAWLGEATGGPEDPIADQVPLITLVDAI
ncbi:MAG: hypothetical protein QOH61_850 [Chloroflexota bacterium]|jgi:hypothetical protein|nr:hypothetical protein [Chloroflexota bacterium]